MAKVYGKGYPNNDEPKWLIQDRLFWEKRDPEKVAHAQQQLRALEAKYRQARAQQQLRALEAKYRQAPPPVFTPTREPKTGFLQRIKPRFMPKNG